MIGTRWKYAPLSPAGSSPRRSNWVAMYLAAVTPPRVPGARPSSASSARNSRWARSTRGSSAWATRAPGEADDAGVWATSGPAAPRQRRNAYARMDFLWQGLGNELELEPLEHRLRQRPDDAHDGTPEPGNVGDVPPALDGAVDGPPRRARAGEERSLPERRRHRRVHVAGLERDDGDAGVVQPVAQPFEEPVQPALGGAVHVVALPPAVAGHRGDHRVAATP